jgi:hypothetical protein
MTRFLFACLAFCGAPAFGESFQRPIPQAQSATAELWFMFASLSLVFALYVVHRLVSRK